MTVCVVCVQLRPGDPRPCERPPVCQGCRSRLTQLLHETAHMYTLLPAQLVPGQAQSQRVSGSREAPLPLRVDPLDLTLPARNATIHDPHGDQIGHLPVATILDSWVRDWRDTLDGAARPPGPTVPELVAWLAIQLPWACNHHPAIDEFARELRQLHGTLTAVTGTADVRPEHLDVPCRRCDLLDLHRLPGEDRVECGSCGDLLTEDEYRRWCGLLAADAS